MGSSKSYSIQVKNVTKKFSIPKEKNISLKNYFLNPFRKIDHEVFTALKEISFKIKTGEFVGIIGRNGSGKTTLLRIIAGIYLPDSGKVVIDGKLTPFLELGVGFSPDLSARDNIYLNGVILGMSRKMIEEKFDEIVNFAEIGEFIDTPLKNFSSGMQVRLAFSIAIQTKSDIYLLDEVLAVGDADFQKKCLAKITSMKSSGKTILFVSHNMEDIEKFCNKVIVLDKNEMKYFGSTSGGVDVYNGIVGREK
ncbi:MAG: ABC transporter ATP-binding protein [Candidatus Dojkabacteria bacterium]|jgi:ABC-2 type transport system ATP-binding protein|nr:ABC transporter ATP-binding protein [Candidatus Dojkabacteria bacterium]